MKTAVSIPDQLFEQVERLARRTRKSRSQLFSEALEDYLARHLPEEITEAMDQVLSEVQPPTEPATVGRRVLENVEW